MERYVGTDRVLSSVETQRVSIESFLLFWIYVNLFGVLEQMLAFVCQFISIRNEISHVGITINLFCYFSWMWNVLDTIYETKKSNQWILLTLLKLNYTLVIIKQA